MNIKLAIITEWREAYKYLSVQLAALVTIVATLEPFLPQMQAYLPAHWFAYASGAILVARMIQQSRVAAPKEAANVADKTI